MKHLATVLIGLSINTLAFAAPTLHVECYEHVDCGHHAGTHSLFSGTIPLGKLRLESIADRSNGKVYFLNFSANGQTGSPLDPSDFLSCSLAAGTTDQWQGQGKIQETQEPTQVQDQCPQLDPVQWQVQTRSQSQDQSCQDQSSQQQAPSQCQAPAPCQGSSAQCEIQCEQQAPVQCPVQTPVQYQEQFQQQSSDQDCPPCLSAALIDVAHIDLFSHESLVDCAHHSAGALARGETRSFSISHHRGLLGFKVKTTCNVTYNGN